eukprot:2856663-Alexandrium_andersonii.AAC.1
MSASLVGSEMCIRDRGGPGPCPSQRPNPAASHEHRPKGHCRPAGPEDPDSDRPSTSRASHLRDSRQQQAARQRGRPAREAGIVGGSWAATVDVVAWVAEVAQQLARSQRIRPNRSEHGAAGAADWAGPPRPVAAQQQPPPLPRPQASR